MPGRSAHVVADSRRSKLLRMPNGSLCKLQEAIRSRSCATRHGVITPEMEFIAIRENLGRAEIAQLEKDLVRDDLEKQHAGSAQLAGGAGDARNRYYVPSVFRRFPQRIPSQITAEFVRLKWPQAAPLFRQTLIIRNPSR